MTTLKGIKGDQIRYLDQDPVVQGIAGATWSSGGNLVSANRGAGGFGIQTAAINYGGEYPGENSTTQSYNGTSWSPVNSMNSVSYRSSGAGTQSAGKRVGGDSAGWSNKVEDWDGTNWTTGTALTTNRAYYNAAAGTQTATIAFGGFTPSSPFPTAGTANVESWNGSSWTEVGDLNTARQVAGTGTQTAVIAATGADYIGTPAVYTRLGNVELWNGTSWTETTEVNTIRSANGASGISTSAIIYGGFQVAAPGYATATEYWDGSTWTEVADLANARGELAGPSTCPSSTAIASGGSLPPSSAVSAYTEEWNAAPSTGIALQEGMLWFNSTSQTLKGYGLEAGIPATTWASGGNMNTGRLVGGGFGLTQDTAVAAGGYAPPGWLAVVEEYNGSAWTEVNDLPTAVDDMGSGGSLTAGICFGGEVPGPSATAAANTYDGTNWTTIASLNTARRAIGGAGISSTSAIAFGGTPGPTTGVGNTETWDGTSWTEVSDLNTTDRLGISGAGVQTAALGIGGSLSVKANVEEWDGSVWTEVGDLNTARSLMGSGGRTTSALNFGGYVGAPTYTAATEFYNGTSWTELNDLSTGRGNQGSLPAGTAGAQISAGGTGPSNLTEEWTATAAVITVTTS
jgi:hypothetical protein